jgi:hypothetical protein
MSLSTIIVALNAQLLRRVRLAPAQSFDDTAPFGTGEPALALGTPTPGRSGSSPRPRA